MIRTQISELQVVGFVQPPTGWPRWRELAVVLALRADPDRLCVPLVWIERDDGTTVEGLETTRASLRDEHGEALRWLDPIHLADHQRLVLDTEGAPEVVSVDDLERARRLELFAHLQAALSSASSGGPDDEVEAHLDRAFDVSAFDPQMLTLRAGFLTEVGLARADDALRDLLDEVGDLDALRGVQRMRGWAHLQPTALRDRWYATARDTMASALESNVTVFHPVIARGVRLRGALLGLLRRRWGFDQPVALPHDLLARGLRGEPRALEEIDRLLGASRDWRLWSELIARAAPRAQEEMARAFGEAPLADALLRASQHDLLGLAENWHTLEINDGRGRAQDWRHTLRGVAHWTPQTGLSPWRNGENLAARLRERAALAQRPIESVHALLLKQFGVRRDVALLKSDGFGVVGAAPRATPPCVFVDADAHGLASRFAATHALAHLLLHGGRKRSEDIVCACSTAPSARADDDERLANAFAAYFLAPRDAVQKRVQRSAPVGSQDFVKQALEIQDAFGLTAVTAAEHLLNCFSVPRAEPLPATVRDELRTAQRERANTFGDADRPRPMLGDRSETYVDTVTRLARRGVLSATDASTLLSEAA